MSGGTVYVGASDGFLYALKLATGTQKWRYDTGGPIAENPAVANGLVFVPSRGGALYALDAVSGTVVWGTGISSGVYPFSPTVQGGFLYVGASNNTLRRYDAATGGGGWVTALDGSPSAAPVVADGRVYAATLLGSIYALRTVSGVPEWSASVGPGSGLGTPGLVGNRLVVTNTGGVVTTYDAITGEVIWTKSGGSTGYSQVTAGAGVVYVSNFRFTTAYDVGTGALLRRIPLGGNSAGVVLADGALYGYDYTERWLTRFDTAPDRDAARPAPASLTPASRTARG